MSAIVHVDLRLNGYLFGCLVLLAAWLATYLALLSTRQKQQIPEFWWASVACAAMGVTEPLFVPEYWDPPSIFKIDRWDLESFLFCFAVGGIAAVTTELPRIKSFFVSVYFSIERLIRFLLSVLVALTGRRFQPRLLVHPPASRLTGLDDPERLRLENALLITFFVGLFGATTHFGINVIYDAAFVCVGTAVLIAWRRPNLRWQIVGGAVTFTVIYTVVLVIMDNVYPGFYEHWNLDDLSGLWLLGAPIEEYVFSFTFGLFWAPMYEVWKGLRA